MVLVQIKVDFKDKGREFYAGETRKISSEDATRFSASGWIGDLPQAHDGDIAPDNIEHHLQA